MAEAVEPVPFESIAPDELKAVTSSELDGALSAAFEQAFSSPPVSIDISNACEENALLMQAGSVLPASFKEEPSCEEIERFWNVEAKFPA